MAFALAGELRVLTQRLSYAKAEELQALLTKSALSQRGTVQVDPRTNTLIITDLADRLTTATELIAKLDLAQPQVEIEARIVQTNKSYARALGVQWGFGGKVDPALGNTTNLAFPNNGSLAGRAGPTQGLHRFERKRGHVLGRSRAQDPGSRPRADADSSHEGRHSRRGGRPLLQACY